MTQPQRPRFYMATASNFIQHGDGIFGLSADGGYVNEFGSIISNVNYSWSAKGDVELTGENCLTEGNVLYDSRCEITWEAFMRKTGTTVPHIGDIVEIKARIMNLCIKNTGEEIPDNITKAIVKGVDVKMESGGYMSFTVKAMYSPNITALSPIA